MSIYTLRESLTKANVREKSVTHNYSFQPTLLVLEVLALKHITWILIDLFLSNSDFSNPIKQWGLDLPDGSTV